MKMYQGVTLDTEDAEVYQHLGINFPLHNAQVIHTGRRITISAPGYEHVAQLDDKGEPRRDPKTHAVLTDVRRDADGNPVRVRDQRIDVLTEAAEPTQSSGSRKVTFTGTSQLLTDGVNVDPADATVTFTIIDGTELDLSAR